MLSPEARANLEKAVSAAIMVRDWMAQPGAKVVLDEMVSLAGKDNFKWLTATDEEAAKIRAMAAPYARFFQVIKKFDMEGRNAAALLQKDREEGGTEFADTPPVDGQGA